MDENRNNKGLIIGIIAVAIVLAIALTVFLFMKGKKDDSGTQDGSQTNQTQQVDDTNSAENANNTNLNDAIKKKEEMEKQTKELAASLADTIPDMTQEEIEETLKADTNYIQDIYLSDMANSNPAVHLEEGNDTVERDDVGVISWIDSETGEEQSITLSEEAMNVTKEESHETYESVLDDLNAILAGTYEAPPVEESETTNTNTVSGELDVNGIDSESAQEVEARSKEFWENYGDMIQESGKYYVVEGNGTQSSWTDEDWAEEAQNVRQVIETGKLPEGYYYGPVL